MHLPNSLYEHAPHYWVFVGFLLIVLGVYLGVQVATKFMFIGVLMGVLSCAWGARVFLRRARKAGEANVAAPSSTAD
jgi:tetrahydromethanopterin S-methyltransferase subunit C